MRARRVITGLVLLLWVVMTSLTAYVLITEGPDILVVISIGICVLLGAAVLGALQEARR